MKKQLLIIISVAVASFLIGTMFSTNYLAMGGGKPNPIWEAIYDLQARVNILTNTVTEQQAQISELQSQIDILNATKLGTPDYDSGWILMTRGEVITLNHNLGTTELLVYFVGKYDADGTIHQWMYGGGYDDNQGAVWFGLTNNQIKIERFIGDVRVPEGQWSQGRVMLWKIPTP